MLNIDSANIETITKEVAMHLKIIDEIKNEDGETKSSQLIHLKSLYSSQLPSNAGPTMPLKILQGFIQKNPKAAQNHIKNHPMNSLSNEEKEEYLQFISDKTKELVRNRITDLQQEIEIEKSLQQAQENKRKYTEEKQPLSEVQSPSNRSQNKDSSQKSARFDTTKNKFYLPPNYQGRE